MGLSDPTLHLKPGREKSLVRRHPWVFSGAVESLAGNPEVGGTLRIVSSRGDFLGWGAFSPHSQIQARVWTWDENESINSDYFHRRLEAAISARRRWITLEKTNAFRLVHGESDGLPGLVIDHYHHWAVVQLLSSGPERWKSEIIAILKDLLQVRGIYERSDVDVRKLEGLQARNGQLWGEPIPEKIRIEEYGLGFQVDLRRGHKTGFYLDQRENRMRIREFCAGADVLDCFSYTGGFTVNALAGGAATVTSVDASEEALNLVRDNLAVNGLPNDRHTAIQADVFEALRNFRDRRRAFDLIILDPPKFAPTAGFAEKAARGYKDINLLALKLIRPGGLLVTFSCSGGIDASLFQKIVAGASLDAGVNAQIIQRLSQAEDHPVALNFPEGEYLKGLIIRKSG